MADRDDHGEHDPPPGWLAGILTSAADARGRARAGWLVVVAAAGFVFVIGAVIMAAVPDR